MDMGDYIEAVPTCIDTSKGEICVKSRLEARFLGEVDKKRFDWIYEPERIGAANYLIDFHLPRLGVWVEVKGEIKAIDERQLPECARILAQRDELLFVFQYDNIAYEIINGRFVEITHYALWQRLKERSGWHPPMSAFPPPDSPPIVEPPPPWEMDFPDEIKPGRNWPPQKEKRFQFGLRLVNIGSVLVAMLSTLLIIFVLLSNWGRSGSLDSKNPSVSSNLTAFPEKLVQAANESITATLTNQITFQPTTTLTDQFQGATAVPFPTAIVATPTEHTIIVTATPDQSKSTVTPVIHTSSPQIIIITATPAPTKLTSTLTPTRVNPFITVTTNALIVRPNPGERNRTVVELKFGATANIIGYTVLQKEETLWWKIQLANGVRGWIVHNPKLYKLSHVYFFINAPINIPAIVP
jgi:hypothetical protein